MEELITQARDSLESRAIAASLQGLADTSRRVYSARINAFLLWYQGSSLDRETVRRYMRALELQGASAHVRNQSLAALKRLASEAGELGWISNEQALQISRIKARKVSGVRTGRWLDAQQCTALLKTPDRSTLSGRRDACVLALLLGCGLRRAEACALVSSQVSTMRNGKVLLKNVKGKGGRIRSVAVPRWAQKDIEIWLKETAQ